MESILTSIKKLLGIAEEYTQFDADIIIHINSVFTTLTQLGVGPSEGFYIEDKETVWEEFIPDLAVGDISDEIHLRDAINSFVASLSQEVRVVFVRRYWYMSSVKDIAADYGITESNVKVMLMRTRNKFKDYLKREEITI